MDDLSKFEADLWAAADNLRANSKLTSSDYFMPVLGIIFLRHAANRFDIATRQIEEDQASGIRDLVEKKLAQMLAQNPQRMDYYKKYQNIIADYNREKDRATVEETFAKVVKLVSELDQEQQRHVVEGLSEEELALFDLLQKENISKADRERLKQASKGLLAALKEHLATMPNWTKNATTQADVQMFILDSLYASLPRPLFSDDDAEALAQRLYSFVWQESGRGDATAA